MCVTFWHGIDILGASRNTRHLQHPTKASKCQGCERGLSSDEFCCPTTDQVPDCAAYQPRTIQTTYLETPYVIIFYFHPLSDCFCLWFCCYDFINMCCISLEGLKWAFAPTSKYKNKHRSGEIFPVFFFFLVLFCGLGWPASCAWDLWAQLWSFIACSSALLLRVLHGRCYFWH